MKGFILLFFSMFILTSLGLSIGLVLLLIPISWFISGIIATWFKSTIRLWYIVLILGLILHFIF